MKNNSGTVLITVLIIFIIVFFVGMFFNRFSFSIRSQANRMSEIRLTEMTAQGLSVAAFHKIQLDLLSDTPSDGGKLKKALAASRPYLKETSLDLLEGKPDFSGIAKALVDPLKEQGSFKYSIHYHVDKNDFSPVATAKDAREKQGFIRLKINTTFRKIDDEFLFACPIKVTSAWLPLLSRFNLFIDDAEAEKNKWRFNLVKTKPDGDLLPGSPNPLVLSNGDRLAGNDLMRIEKFLARRVGWVYFGGNQPTILNLAQGTNSVGEFFHLYETWDTNIGQFVGFYETAYFPYSSQGINGLVATVQWDKGIADEVAAGVNPPHWFKMIEGTPDEMWLTSNSVFRLYGIDKHQSPTLVLGKVYRGVISARGYQSNPKNLVPAQIFQWVARNQWPEYISFDTDMAASVGLASIATMARDILGLDDKDIDQYREKYASQGTQQGYNASLAFIATNRVMADPYGNFSGWLAKVMQARSDISEMTRLPLAVGGYNQEAAVPGLAELISGVEARSAMVIEIDEKAGAAVSLPDLLADKGMLRKSSHSLDLGCWALIKAKSPCRLVVDQPLKLVDNGGIIIERGDLLIAKEIDGGQYEGKAGDEREETPKFTLQLVALDGNIMIGAAKVDASLTANGKILFGKEKPVIRGSLAMKHYDIQNASAGAELFYNQNLALESCSSPENLELLGFRLNPTPVYLK